MGAGGTACALAAAAAAALLLDRLRRQQLGGGGADHRVRKVVILAAGLGTRMRKAAEGVGISDEQAKVAATGVKALIPVQHGDINRPFLDYILNAVADAGFTKVCLVIGPDHTALREYYSQAGFAKRISISFAIQEKPLGTADAVAAAELFCGRDRFIVLNSDNYYPVPALRALHRGIPKDAGLAVFTREGMVRKSNVSADRIPKFAVVKVNAMGCLERILEKPSPEVIASLPEPVGVSMNCWLFEANIFEACAAIEPSPRGELEITDAVQYCIDHGTNFHVKTFNDGVLDMSSREDISSVVARLGKVKVHL